MHHKTHDILAPVPGICRQIHSFHFGPRGAGKVYIQASLHADELPGMLVAWHLKQRLGELRARAACATRSCWCPSPTRWAWNRC